MVRVYPFLHFEFANARKQIIKNLRTHMNKMSFQSFGVQSMNANYQNHTPKEKKCTCVRALPMNFRPLNRSDILSFILVNLSISTRTFKGPPGSPMRLTFVVCLAYRRKLVERRIYLILYSYKKFNYSRLSLYCKWIGIYSLGVKRGQTHNGKIWNAWYYFTEMWAIALLIRHPDCS